MATLTIAPEAQAIIDRLAAIDLGKVNAEVDRERVERALRAHYAALGLTTPPVRWVTDAEAAYAHVFSAAESAARSAAWSAAWSAARSAAESAARSAAWSAAESAARSAARSAAWSAAWSGIKNPAIEKYIGIWMPFVDAFEAGLWLFFPTETEVIAVPRPVLHLSGERLHRIDGPAVHWPGGAEYFFWRGLQVSADVILRPETITVPKIHGELNAEMRRVLIERYGEARYLRDAGAAIVARDERGVLYQMPLEGDEPLTMVEVINSTPEPDGSHKAYWIRVPPTMKTPREAVAWTFGLKPETYRPAIET